MLGPITPGSHAARHAVLRKGRRGVTPGEVAAHLPPNYKVTGENAHSVTISGEDDDRYTLHGYVLPKLAAALIFGEEAEDPWGGYGDE